MLGFHQQKWIAARALDPHPQGWGHDDFRHWWHCGNGWKVRPEIGTALIWQIRLMESKSGTQLIWRIPFFHTLSSFFMWCRISFINGRGVNIAPRRNFWKSKTNESCVFLRLCDVLLTSAFNFLFVVPVKTKRWHVQIGRWFQIFFMFTLTWGNDPIWLIFFKGVETTN